MESNLTQDPFKRKSTNNASKKSLVLTKDWLNRLKSHTQFLQKEKMALELEKQKRQRMASRKLKNTFSQKPQAKDEARKKQYTRDVECARQELEREVKMNFRKDQVLDQCYQKLFEETDRVKHFKTAKNLCEMQKQREDQKIEESRQREKMSDYEAQFALGLLRDVDHYNAEEKERLRILEENKKKNSQNWIKQHKEVLLKKVQEEKEDHRDGFLIQEEIRKEEQKAEEKNKLSKQKVVDYKNALDRQMKEKLQLLEMHQLLEKAEDERAQLFNEFKKEVQSKHKELQSEKMKRRNAKIRRAADNMVDEKAIIIAKENAALEQVVLEDEVNLQKEQTKRALVQAKNLKALEDFYENERELNHKKKFESKLKKFQDAQSLNDFVEKLKTVEDARLQQHQDLLKEAQHIQLHQIEKRRRENKLDKARSIEDYLHHMKSLDNEEAMFQTYAQRQIEECEKRGVDTYAMRKAARPGIECGKGPLFEDRGHIRPRYHASVWKSDDMPHISRVSNQPDTKSRLGFLL